MDDSGRDELDIEPSDIPAYIQGNADVACDSVVRCGGVDVCLYSDGRMTHVACDHPRHGPHPRFRELYRSINDIMDRLKVRGGVDDGPCPKCDGLYWLEAESAAACQEVVLSLAVGMWRGVPFGASRLSSEGAAGMIETFLSALKAGGTSSCPAGMAAPGRAFYNGETANGAEDQGIDKGKGGSDGDP